MGNNSNPLATSNQRYTHLGIDQHELLSTLILIKYNSTQEKLLLKQMNIASDLDYAKLTKEFKQRKLLSDRKLGKYLVRVREVEGKESSEICGKSFKLLLYIEYLPNTLKNIFQERIKTKRYFEEDQLMRLVRSLVNGLIVLHDNNFKNVYLHKEAVVITSENAYKLLDTQLCNRIHPFFEILNGVPPKNATYLAPELLADIRRGSADYYHSPKADLFTLGVLLIQLATLTDCDRFYDYEHKTVQVDELRELASQLQFSRIFRELLLCLLQEEEEERIGLLSLREMVSAETDTLPNQEFVGRESSQFANPTKQSARTAVTKSHRLNTTQQQTIYRQQGNSLTLQPSTVQTNLVAPQQLQRVIQPPTAYRQISHYINNLQSKQHSSQVSKRNQQTIQPVYLPVAFQSAPSVPSIQVPLQQAPLQMTSLQVAAVQAGQDQSQLPKISITNTLPIIPVKSTPKAHSLQNYHFHIQTNKEFDTPVNLLIQNQHSPEVTPLPRIEETPNNSPQHPPIPTHTQQHPPVSQNNQKPEIQVIKTDVFNYKSYGRLDFSNGARYQGEFNNKGEFDGNGMLYYPDGKVCYSGSWKSNAFHGFGVLHNQTPTETAEQTPYWSFDLGMSNWKYYEGEFNMDHKEGFGTLYMTNGDKFSGCFKNDCIEGFGTFFIAQQQKYVNGIWVNNVLKH